MYEFSSGLLKLRYDIIKFTYIKNYILKHLSSTLVTLSVYYNVTDIEFYLNISVM